MNSAKETVLAFLPPRDENLLGQEGFDRTALSEALTSILSDNKRVMILVTACILVAFGLGLYLVLHFASRNVEVVLTLLGESGFILACIYKLVEHHKEITKINLLLALLCSTESDNDLRYLMRSLIDEL